MRDSGRGCPGFIAIRTTQWQLMSPQNVEIVRRILDLANQGDVEGIMALMAPDIECVPASGQPESKPFRGRQAIEYQECGTKERALQAVVDAATPKL